MSIIRLSVGVFVFMGIIQADTLTLRKAQALLFDNNKDLLIENKNTTLTEYDLKTAKTGLQPTVSAYASYGYNSDIPEFSIDMPLPIGTQTRRIGGHDRVEFGIDVTYPFFTGLSRYNSIQSARLKTAAQKETVRSLKNILSYHLGMLYFSWGLAHETVKVRRLYLDQVRAYVTQVLNLKSSGLTVAAKVLEAQSSEATAEAAFTSAENRYDSLRMELVNLIKPENENILPEEYTLVSEGAGLDSIFSLQARTDRPEIRILDTTARQLSFSRKALLGQCLPTLGGTAGYRVGKPGINMGSTDYMDYWLLGIRADWKIYDGMKTRSQMNQMSTQIEIVDLKKQKLIDDLTKRSQNSRLMIMQAKKEIAAAQKAEQAAALYIEDLKNGLSAGTVTSLEYLNAMNNHTSAQLNVAIARFKLSAACLSYLYASGQEILY